MTRAELYTKEKSKTHTVYKRAIIYSEKNYHLFYFFGQNESKLSSAELLYKDAYRELFANETLMVHVMS